MDTDNPLWTDEEVKYVEDELSQEYPALAATTIQSTVRATLPTVHPDDGRYQLLSAARRNLPR